MENIEAADVTETPCGPWITKIPPLWWEVAAVLFWFAAPTIADIAGGLVSAAAEQSFRGQGDHATLTTFYVRSFFYSLAPVPLLLLLMLRSGEGWSHFGLVRPNWAKDVLLGVGLTLLVGTTYFLILAACMQRHRSLVAILFPATNVDNRVMLAFVSSCAIGFAYELFHRAYLIPQFEALTGAMGKALALSVAVAVLMQFGSVWRWENILHVGIEAAIWGVAFCITRSIWPVAISHTLVHFVLATNVLAHTPS